MFCKFVNFSNGENWPQIIYSPSLVNFRNPGSLFSNALENMLRPSFPHSSKAVCSLLSTKIKSA